MIRYGEKALNAGNSVHDIPVWNHAGQVIVVNPEKGLLDKVGDSADLLFSKTESFHSNHLADL